MLKPAVVKNVRTVGWTFANRRNAIPALFHSAWQAPDGRFAIVLANWTDQSQKAVIREPRLGEAATFYLSSRQISQKKIAMTKGLVELSVPPLSAALLVSFESVIA